MVAMLDCCPNGQQYVIIVVLPLTVSGPMEVLEGLGLFMLVFWLQIQLNKLLKLNFQNCILNMNTLTADNPT